MKYAALVATLLALAAVTPVEAQDSKPAAPLPLVSLGEPGYGGSGCPDGTATIIRGFSNQAAIYLFDDYKVGANGRAVDRQTCGLAIPVDVPAGVQVAIRHIAVRGTTKLPDGLDATLNVEAFTAGTQGDVNELTLSGQSGFLRYVSIPDDKLNWSGCGEATNLRINTSLRTRGDKDADATVNTLILYPLAARAC